MISFPPAKINIGLHIQSKRDDGYHLLNAFFVPIGLKDILEIVPAVNGVFRFEQTGITVDCAIEDNLCVKAYRMLQKDYDVPPVHMQLHKQIPFGAGLGGGSADASYVLLEINRLFNLGISEKSLVDYALRLGADCPFFIRSQSAFVSGIGEEIMPLKESPFDGGHQLVLLKPEVSIPTKQAYAGVNISGDAIASNALNETPIAEWKNVLHNDFEKHLFVHHPELKQLKDFLYSKGAIFASMTGSGAAVYGIFDKGLSLSKTEFPDFVWMGEL